MAVTSLPAAEGKRLSPRLRKLEDERWLALALLTPTAVLLGLFIAYPFFEGVMLSLSSTRVGQPGEFVGLKNFHKIWNDSWNDAAASVNQINSVKQATAEEREIKKTRNQLLGRAFELWNRMEMLWSNVGGFQRVIVFFTQLTVFVFSVDLVANGSLTIGELVALNGYSMMFFGPFVQLGYSWQTIQNGLTSAGQIERIFREPT